MLFGYFDTSCLRRESSSSVHIWRFISKLISFFIPANSACRQKRSKTGPFPVFRQQRTAFTILTYPCTNHNRYNTGICNKNPCGTKLFHREKGTDLTFTAWMREAVRHLWAKGKLVQHQTPSCSRSVLLWPSDMQRVHRQPEQKR